MILLEIAKVNVHQHLQTLMPLSRPKHFSFGLCHKQGSLGICYLAHAS